jgi:putative lipoprotein
LKHALAALTAFSLAGCATTAAAQPIQQAPVLPLANAASYICDDGHLVTTDRDRPAGILRVVRGGETHVLQEQIGYTPSRFVQNSVRVDLGGETATITFGVTNRSPVIARCARVPAAPVAGTLWGTLTSLDRTALPEGTRARVLLEDAARADAPPAELGSTLITTSGNQMPLHFLIRYDPARVAPPGSPRLQARIETATGRLMSVTDTAKPIPAEGPAPSPVELMLVRIGGQ